MPNIILLTLITMSIISIAFCRYKVKRAPVNRIPFWLTADTVSVTALAVFTIVLALLSLTGCSKENTSDPIEDNAPDKIEWPEEDDPSTPWDDRYTRPLTQEEIEELEKRKEMQPEVKPF